MLQAEKLEIKKDKKGMVVVAGSEVKEARNPKELFALFDQGTQNRHTASTSTSHRVTSIADVQPRRYLVIVTLH